MFKIHFPDRLLDINERSEIFPLIRPFLKHKNYTDEERKLEYGISDQDFNIFCSREKAQIIILPMSWNYYTSKKKLTEVYRYIEQNSNSKIISFLTGDYGVPVKNYSNLIVLRQNGYRSDHNANHLGMPVFIKDPFKSIDQSNTALPIYGDNPIVGFCGQTNESILNCYREITRVLFRNLKYKLGLSLNLPQKVISSTYNRSMILKTCEKSHNIKSNFIKRKKYRANAFTKNDRERTTQEYFDNMFSSQYIICYRGGGNFSVRLYETLATGRIPVFVNSDCLIPISDSSFWNSNVVQLTFKDLTEIEEIILNFHEKNSPKDLFRISEENRRFWEEKLTFNGFFKELIKNILHKTIS